MNERYAYYNWIEEAEANPEEVLSCIGDGMAQTHTQCPYLGNLSKITSPLEQKIQGIIDHGRKKFNMYRIFPFVKGNSNVSIHTFLLNLEEWRRNNDERYPRKIYWQIDGGPENANKFLLALCEYLVASTPIEEIYLSRLPVGHTHEDIDARYDFFSTTLSNILCLS
jgi:hypothetical protein